MNTYPYILWLAFDIQLTRESVAPAFPPQARALCGARRAYVTVVVLPLATFLLYAPYLFLGSVVPCTDEWGE